MCQFMASDVHLRTVIIQNENANTNYYNKIYMKSWLKISKMYVCFFPSPFLSLYSIHVDVYYYIIIIIIDICDHFFHSYANMQQQLQKIK